MAVENKYAITVNTKSKMFREIPEVVAGDNVVFDITVYEGPVLFALLDTYTYKFVSKKLSGNPVIRDASKVDGVIRVVLGTSEMTVPGKVEGTVQIFDANMKRISTATFNYVVRKDPSMDGNLPNDEKNLVIANESLLVDAIAKSKTASTESATALTKATTAETKATNAETTANTVKDQFNQVVAQAGSNNPEVVASRGGEVNLGVRLDKFSSLLAQIETQLEKGVGGGGSYWFEAPGQPSFNSLDSNSIWDGMNKTFTQFRTEMIEPLIAQAPSGYVSRNLLGKDASGLHDIYEYIFEPEHFEQTLLLGSGMHARETVPFYSMYRLMYYLIKEPDVHPDIRMLRSKVKIVMLPDLGIWGGNQNPKTYTQSNGNNISRNFPVNWEYLDYRPASKESPDLNSRSLLPLDLTEAQILYDWFHKYKDEASCYMDMHTDYSFLGQAPSKDFWVLTSDNKHMIHVLEQCASYFDERIRKLYNREPVTVVEKETYYRSTHMMYPNDILGIPACAMEFCETRFGGRFGGSQDIQNHLTLSVNLMIQFIKYNFPEKKRIDDLEYSMSHLKGSTLPVHALNENLNAMGTVAELYAYYDKMQGDFPNEITKSILIKDTSGTHDICEYVFTPPVYDKTILIYTGLYGFDGNYGKESFVVAKLMDLIYRNAEKHPVFNKLKYGYKFVVIPIGNPHGFNVNTVVNKQNRVAMPVRSRLNSNGVLPYYNFDYKFTTSTLNGNLAMSEKETQAVKLALGKHSFDATIHVSGLYDLVHLYAKSNNKLLTEFYKAYKNLEKHRNPNKIRSIIVKAKDEASPHGYISSMKNIEDSVTVLLGDDTFASGTPAYKANKTEMKRHIEGFTTALYNFLNVGSTVASTPPPISTPTNIVPLFNDPKWTIHSQAVVEDGGRTVSLTPTSSFRNSTIRLDVQENTTYSIEVTKIPAEDIGAIILIYTVIDGVLSSSSINPNDKTKASFAFTTPTGCTQIEVRLGNDNGQINRTFKWTDLSIYKA